VLKDGQARVQVRGEAMKAHAPQDGQFGKRGIVSDSNREQEKVTVLISYFSKETPFVFDLLQVEKTGPFLR
jgi:hypothetical protein